MVSYTEDQTKRSRIFSLLSIKSIKMHIFGLAFILYYLKWSDGNGFWIKYRQSDEESYKQAIKV